MCVYKYARYVLCILEIISAQTSLSKSWLRIISHYVSFRESFERVDSLIFPFGQTAIYLFPPAFAINTERKWGEKKMGEETRSVFLAVYRCASSALSEMKKGDLVPVPHFATTAPACTHRRWRCGKQERREKSPKGRRSAISRWYWWSRRTGPQSLFRFHRTRRSVPLFRTRDGRIDDRFDRQTKSERGSTSITEPFRPSSSLCARAREIVPNGPRAV